MQLPYASGHQERASLVSVIKGYNVLSAARCGQQYTLITCVEIWSNGMQYPVDTLNQGRMGKKLSPVSITSGGGYFDPKGHRFASIRYSGVGHVKTE